MYVVADARDKFALECRAAAPAHHRHAGIWQIGQRGGRGELPLRGKPLDGIYHRFVPTFWPRHRDDPVRQCPRAGGVQERMAIAGRKGGSPSGKAVGA
jgi:hypothetical protein